MATLDLAMLKQNIENRIYDDLKNNKVGAADILVNQSGKRVYEGRFGTKTINGEPLERNTIFRAASMTKPITAAAVLIECEKGNINLDAKVSEYLEGYDDLYVGKLKDGKLLKDYPAKRPVRVYQLLSHTSGIGTGSIGDVECAAISKESNSTLAGTAQYFSEQPLAFEPFSAQEYSATAAFDVAAHIVEKVSGLTYDQYLKNNIFDKLGMKDTTFAPSPTQWERLIWMHNRTESGEAIIGDTIPGCIFTDIPITHFCGGAGLVITAEDYSLFAEMLLNNGKARSGQTVISQEMICKMQTPYVSEDIMQGRERWGLGVRIITNRQDTALPCGAFGWSGAWGTHFWVDPVNEITAVYLKNSQYDGGAGCRTAENFEKDVMLALS